MRVAHRVGALMVLAEIIVGPGCATSKYVSSITSREGQVKFLYYQRSLLDVKQGLVQCKAAQDGELSDCVDHPVVFRE